MRLAINSFSKELEMLKKVKMCLAMSVMILCLSGGALAGHTRPGGEWCTCGCSGCFCDPGETPGNCTNSVVGQPKPVPGTSGDTLPTSGSTGDGGAFLFGSLVLMALARL